MHNLSSVFNLQTVTDGGYHGNLPETGTSMTPQRFQQIRRLFESVIDLPPPARASALRDVQQRDANLAVEVEALISAYDRRTGFMEQPVADLRALDPLAERETDSTGMVVGPYRLLQLIGRGGMGEVWHAEQRHPVQRVVAVKLIKAGMDTREVVARFESERQALALMNHPAIAKVFDAGSTTAGRPYFAMEYVAGIPITTYCDRQRLTLRDRLKLFIRVCEGVQHAHQKAIIHRDLKPSNILVTELDGKPVPKIIDFGVARAVSQQLTARTLLTRAGVIVGTPEYMSPEQGDAGEDVDTRTDVYSLGVVLYELLVGAVPISFRKLPLDEIMRKLRDEDTVRPSAKVRVLENQSVICHNRRIEPGSLIRHLRGDLDAITLKALEKDRSRRYGTPSELAADIGNYLHSVPISARAPTVTYQVRKYILRHRVTVAIAAFVVLMLASVGILEAIQIRRITRERDRADRISNFMSSMFRVSNPSASRGNLVTAREILDKASAGVSTGLANDPELQAQMMDVMGTVYDNLGLYPQAESLLAKAVAIRRRIFGTNDARTAQSIMNLADALTAEGHRSEANRLDQEALLIRRQLLGPEDPDTLRSMSNMARHLVGAGRYVEAEHLHRTVYTIRSRVLGPEHPDTLTSMDDLGNTLGDEGRYAEAEALERGVLDIKQKIQGPDHPETLRALHHVADTLYEEGRYVESEKLHRELMNRCLRVFGPDHSEALNAMVALANSLDDAGRYADAEKLVRRALASELRILGPEHPETLITMNNLAELLGDEGRYREAEKLHRDVLAARARVQGPAHAYTLYSMSKLAWILILEGRLDEAESLSRTAREQQFRVLGPDHPDAAETTYNLAVIAALRGRTADALLTLRDSVDHGLKPREVRRIETDAILKPLHADPRFEALVSYARKRSALDPQAH